MNALDPKRIIAEIAARHGIKLDAKDPMMAVVTLNELALVQFMTPMVERIEAAENCMRFYRFELFRNLFGDWQLDREWGRIGRLGTIGSTLHGDIEDALNCAHAILALKVSRGYDVRTLNWERSNIARLRRHVRTKARPVADGRFDPSPHDLPEGTPL